jgi:hypothetical protein
MSINASRLYDTYEDARQAVTALEARGVSAADISLISSNAENWFKGDKTGADKIGAADSAEGAAAGAGIGAGLGGVAGLLAGLGLLAIPGLGPVVAAGWLVATAVGAAAGAATGGIIGVLTGAGLSESDAEFYAEGLRRGGTLVSVRASETDAAMIEKTLAQSAVNPRRRRAAWENSGWKAFDPTAEPLTADEIRQQRALYR